MLAEHEEAHLANVALVRRFIEAINDSWNVDVMRDLVSDDFLFVIPFAPDWFQVRYEGKDKALAFLNSVRDLMDPENPATNLPYRNEYIGRFRIKDGKITAFPEYLDPTRFVTAVGGAVVPPSTMNAGR